MKTTITTKTFLKKEKKNKNGNVPIYIRFSVNQTEISFSTGYFVDKERWKSTLYFKNTRNKEEQEIRKDIDDTLEKLQEIVTQFEEDEESYNAEMVKNRLFKKDIVSTSKNLSFIQCFELHKAEFLKNGIQERIVEQKQTADEANKNAKLCYRKYGSMKEKLVDYLKQDYKVQDMPMKKFDDNIQKDFLFYLKGKVSKNTAQRYFISFNAIFHFAKRKKLIADYPFTDDFKIKYDKSKTHSLTIQELHTVMTKEFSTERLNVVKDVFVWLCLTGYSYKDYFRIKRSNIEERCGKMFIVWKRIKTHEDEDVPLLPDAIALIKKYDNHPDCVATGAIMPLRSAVKLNEYLKEISAICKINKHFTTRVARKTFGSILVNAGVNILPISKLVGHKDSRTTEKFYLTVEDKTKVDTMEVYHNELEKHRTSLTKKLKVA